MFLGHSTGWWGIFLSAVAILLAIPLSVVGNLLTPRLRNWWAQRSVNSLRNRIINLEKRLAFVSVSYKEIGEFEDFVLELLDTLFYVVAGGAECTGFALLVLSAPIRKRPEIGRLEMAEIFLVALLVAVIFMLAFVSTVMVRIFRRRHSPKIRREMRNLIASLKAKFERRTGRRSFSNAQQ